jgi:hypothetical protein
MPSPDEIEKIAECFGSKYGVDIAILRHDAIKLKSLVDRRAQKAVSSTEIYSDSITYTPSGNPAYLPDLETFEFSDIPNDPRLVSSRVEQNLDEATRYADNCLQSRRLYGEMGKLRNDTRFKFEEFVRLDLVHREEVEAGLYELPLQDAAAERAALESGVTEATLQLNIVDDMLGKTDAAKPKYSGVLSDRVSTYITNSKLIARNTANDDKQKVDDASGLTTTYRTDIEYATWLQTQSIARGSVDQQKAKFTAATKKEEYLSKDVGFRSHRASISRQLAWLQIGEHCRENSALNYEERLNNQRLLFNDNLRHLVERIVSLKKGLMDCYDIDIPLPDPSKGQILDKVAVWLVYVQDELSKYKRGQRVVIYSKTTDKPLNVIPSAVANAPEKFEVELFIDKIDLPSAHSLLRGVAFEFFGTQSRPISLSVQPPNNAITSYQKNVGASRVGFGRVCPFTAGLELKPQHADLFWNGSGEGVWNLQGTFEKAGSIDSIILHMWMVTV